MPRSEFDSNFANAGWQRKEFYDFDDNFSVRLVKGKKLICASFNSPDGVVTAYSVYFFTDDKATALQMYNKAKKNFASLLGEGNGSSNNTIWHREGIQELVTGCHECLGYPAKANKASYISSMGGPVLDKYSAYIFRK